MYILLHSCNGKNNCKRAGTVVEGKALEQYAGVIRLKAFENTSEIGKLGAVSGPLGAGVRLGKMRKGALCGM